jgi:hypothetical protein
LKLGQSSRQERPLTNAIFAGRLDQVHQIVNAISQRGYHAVLFGERGVGKTSLSNVLRDFLSEAGKTVAVSRINCDASDTFTSLWKKALRDIVVIKSKPAIGSTADEIEETHEIVHSLPDVIGPDDIRRVLTDLSKGVILVIAFDEFDRIGNKQITVTMADTIKTLSDYAIPSTILLIGVADSVDDLVESHQSIERALVQIPMPRMSDQEIREIISNGLSRLKMEIDPEALEEIVSLSQGLPYITHLLALHTARATLAAGEINIDGKHVAAGIQHSLDQWQQSITSSYYNATKSPQPDNIYKQVLLACALADIDDLRYFTAAAVRKPLRIITEKAYEIPNFAKHLKDFSDAGRGNILQRTGEKRRIRYRFNSPIMRPYIIMRGRKEGILTRQMLGAIGEE